MKKYLITAAFAQSVLSIKTPWCIANDDHIVGVYASRAQARAFKAKDSSVGKVVRFGEVEVEVLKAPVVAPVTTATKTEKPAVEKDEFAKVTKAEHAVHRAEKVINNKSTIESPCQVVWNLADAMKGARRKDVLAAAEAKGVAYYTARTQYQLWSQVQKEMAERENKQANKKSV